MWKHGKGWELGDLNPKTSPGAMTTADRILAQPELLRTLDIRQKRVRPAGVMGTDVHRVHGTPNQYKPISKGFAIEKTQIRCRI